MKNISRLLFLILFLFYGKTYAADTITILDGLTNAHAAATSTMWFIDSATTGSGAVAQYVVNIPDTANRIRVKYDNTHSTAADIFTRARLSKITAISTLTKAVEAVDAWAEVTQGAGGVREGATIDISPNYQATLYIDACLSEAVAETAGATIYVEVSSNTTGDADWSVITSFGGPTGTAESEALSGDEAAGQTVLSVTNPTTANLDNPSRFIFFEDTASAANSEIIFQVTNEGD
jgi:hypothetical protein